MFEKVGQRHLNRTDHVLLMIPERRVPRLRRFPLSDRIHPAYCCERLLHVAAIEASHQARHVDNLFELADARCESLATN